MSVLRNALNNYKKFGELAVKSYYKRHIRIPDPVYRDGSAKIQKPLLVVCTPKFDQHFPIAASLMRIGFARGWAEKYGYAKLISVFDIEKEIVSHDKPAVFLSTYDYQYIDKHVLLKLRDTDTFVWASIHPRKIAEYEKMVPAEKGQLDYDIWRRVYADIVYSQPKFMWNSTCRETFNWYSGWIDDGFAWQTIHPAIDTAAYYPENNKENFAAIKMAYVGGYWGEKAQAFDAYLRPFEEILYPFGYSRWPYKNYGGQLKKDRERQLYSTAGLVPLITSPAGWLMGEITERYFKAPACRAFCISDENAAMKETFSNGEFLLAQNAEHFHHLVNDYLSGKTDTDHWRQKGFDAVMQKHLYINRAEQIMQALTPR